VKRFILEHYKPNTRGSGFDTLAIKFGVHSGGTISKWWKECKGNLDNIKSNRSNCGRKRKLTDEQVEEYVGGSLDRWHDKRKLVSYPTIHREVVAESKVDMSLRTVTIWQGSSWC
jgi:hypothetical protein